MERSDLDPVGGPLVVQRVDVGPGAVGAHRERAAGVEHLGADQFVGPGRGRERRRVEDPRAHAQLVGGEHRLDVLLLVLGDHAEHEPVVHEPAAVGPRLLEDRQRALADRGAVGPGLGRVEQRQLGASGAGVGERVVEVVDVLTQTGARVLPRRRAAHQPEILHVRDVRHVPVQRRHQRGVLVRELGVVDGVGERACALPCRGELVGEAPAQGVGVARGGAGVIRPCGEVARHRWSPPWTGSSG